MMSKENRVIRNEKKKRNWKEAIVVCFGTECLHSSKETEINHEIINYIGDNRRHL